MRRRLFTAVSFFSLALCLAACAMWARSYWARDFVMASDAARWWGLTNCTDGVALKTEGQSGDLASAPNRTFWWSGATQPAALVDVDMYRTNAAFSFHLPGFHLEHDAPPAHLGQTAGTTMVHISHWLLALLAALLPAYWLVGYRRRHRPGCCSSCGYDLRGSTGACPECGTTIV